MSPRSLRIAPLVVLLAAVAPGGCAARHSAVPEANGTLELVDVDVAPLVPARVTRVLRREGAPVHAGDTLVALAQPTTAADLDAMRARLAAARSELRDLEAGARTTEIAQGEADLRAADAEATRAVDDRRRFEPLAASGAISRQQYDAAVAAERAATARRDAAREQLRQLRQGARPERIAAARAEVANARAALEAAVQMARDLVLTAPVTGTVLSRNVEPGEVVAAGTPAMTLGDAALPYVRVYVGQDVLPRLAVGQRAMAVLDAFPDRPIAGRIAALSPRAEFTPRVALTEEERADLLFAVRVEFADTTGLLKAGLPVTVRFVEARAP